MALVFYMASSILSFKRDSFERTSKFLDLLAVLSLLFTFSYKIDEENFKLHSLNENKIESPPEKLYLSIAIFFTGVTLTGAFF